MRKALKIKASVFIIAWLCLFVHNVLPHNHIDYNQDLFGHLVHNSHSCSDNEEDAARVTDGHLDDHTCCLSYLLFNTISPEIILSYSVIDQDFNPGLPGSGINPDFNRLYYSPGKSRACLLRAPPLS